MRRVGSWLLVGIVPYARALVRALVSNPLVLSQV